MSVSERNAADVTDRVKVGEPDGETAPLLRCVCGAEYDAWDNFLSIYPDMARPQSCCGRRLYVSIGVRVLEGPEGRAEG